MAQDGGGDVIRQVRDYDVGQIIGDAGASEQRRRRAGEDIGFDNRDVRPALKLITQEVTKPRIDLDGDDLAGCVAQQRREQAGAGADLENDDFLIEIACGDDLGENASVYEKVLAKSFSRRDPGFG